jgi:hypothetical protein
MERLPIATFVTDSFIVLEIEETIFIPWALEWIIPNPPAFRPTPIGHNPLHRRSITDLAVVVFMFVICGAIRLMCLIRHWAVTCHLLCPPSTTLSSVYPWLRLRKFFHTTLRCPAGIQSFSGNLTAKRF